MWGSIISGVTSLASDFIANKKTKIESAARIEEAKTEARIKQIERAAQGEIDYDLEALRQTQYSWKDEFALLVVVFPFIGAFLPWTQEYVEQGWIFLSEKTPEYYWWIFSGAIAASMGIRWAVSAGKK